MISLLGDAVHVVKMLQLIKLLFKTDYTASGHRGTEGIPLVGSAFVRIDQAKPIAWLYVHYCGKYL